MTPTPEEELRNEIRAAFPSRPFFGTATSCDCEECESISAGLRNRSWEDVPVAFLDFTCSPTLLTPAAFQAFLPAYMLRALDKPFTLANVVLEFTIYSMSSHSLEDEVGKQADWKRTWLKECSDLMTGEQLVAVRSFLLFVAGHGPETEWLNQFIQPALHSTWQLPQSESTRKLHSNR